MSARPVTSSYRWVALSNTTVGMLIVTINSSITLISLPAIFRGIALDPLTPANVSYLLWMLMGFMVVSAVLVVGLGRVGDMFGRVRVYNLGFAVFTVASIALSLVLWQGSSAAIALIALRVVQGIGGAMLMANSTAILTDAFPAHQRGMALGVNSVSAIAGSFLGLVIGGLLSTVNWHLVFLVSVPIGVFGTIWAYLMLREIGTVRRARMDWWGNVTFGAGLILLLIGITYGIQPYGTSDMGWTNPTVLAELGGAIVLLVAFLIIETRVAEPMFHLGLFKLPAFAAGNLASLLASIGRGGLMFMIIIWLQGIWLPLHGYNYEDTPFWSAIFMLPMSIGFLIAGPLSGVLSDRFGQRPFAVGGMVGAAATFGLLAMLPADFSYPVFAALLLLNGLFMGLFSAPNTAGVMNAVPADQRGAASGMRATFMNAGMNLSIGLFFSLMIAGLSSTLPSALSRGLTSAGIPAQAAQKVAELPPVSTLFAAFLGYNPMQKLLGPLLTNLPAAKAAFLTGKTFFPQLIANPFMSGMRLTFTFAAAMMLVAAAASMFMGKRRHEPAAAPARPAAGETGAPRAARLAPTVAISATYGARGQEIAQRVARVLRVPLIDRAIPAEVLHRLPAPKNGELADDGLGSLLRELRTIYPHGDGDDGDDDAYRRRSQELAREIASTTGGVILGHGASVTLRDRPAVLRVRLDGPVERRLELAAAAEHIDPEEARRRQRAGDHAREVYVRRFYDADPSDPALYHLTLDSTTLSPRACAALIATAAWTLTAGAPRQDEEKTAPVKPALDVGTAS